MAQSKNAADYRRWNREISGNLLVTTATDDTTLVTAKSANETLYIQRIVVYIITSAAQSISFEDSAASPIQVALVATSPSAGSRWEFTFGDIGCPLTAGKNFLMNVSAVGIAAQVEWQGYARQTTAMAPGPTNG